MNDKNLNHYREKYYSLLEKSTPKKSIQNENDENNENIENQNNHSRSTKKSRKRNKSPSDSLKVIKDQDSDSKEHDIEEENKIIHSQKKLKKIPSNDQFDENSSQITESYSSQGSLTNSK